MSNKQYEIPTGDRVTISPTLKKEIKKRFQTDRENRFQRADLSIPRKEGTNDYNKYM